MRHIHKACARYCALLAYCRATALIVIAQPKPKQVATLGCNVGLIETLITLMLMLILIILMSYWLIFI